VQTLEDLLADDEAAKGQTLEDLLADDEAAQLATGTLYAGRSEVSSVLNYTGAVA
jgi:hypothetical protein